MATEAGLVTSDQHEPREVSSSFEGGGGGEWGGASGAPREIPQSRKSQTSPTQFREEGGHALPSFDQVRKYEVTGFRVGGRETQEVPGFQQLGLAE